MFQQTVGRFSMLAVAAGVMLACDGDHSIPVAPDQRASLKEESVPAVARALTRKKALTEEITATATIGQEGGSFAIPAAGLSVVVPPGAVAEPTVFAATALAGDMIAYDFAPHGSQFNVPLQVTQDLKETSWTKWKKLDEAPVLEVGYFRDRTQLDQQLRTAVIDEFLPTQYQLDKKELRFDVEHFSGYMVSSGRVSALQQ